jgi:hypothetical protein
MDIHNWWFQIETPSSIKLAHPAGLSPANSPFEAEDDSNFTTDAKLVLRQGLAP